MRHDDRPRARPARNGSPPSELSPVAAALATVCALAIGAWLFTRPLAAAVASVALGVVLLLLVGVPLAVVRGVIALLAVLDGRKRTATPDPVPRDTDVEASESVDATASAE